ncbi:MAG: hypothetical protein RR276_09520, partial [Angelakisella sp.]
ITGTTSNFGAVYLFNGTVNMYEGATITENTNLGTLVTPGKVLSGLGGGVTVAGGTFTLHGGVISQNHAKDGTGGGIGVGRGDKGTGKLVVTGAATITGNDATWGGGIGLLDDATAELTGGQLVVTGNTAANAGGGIYLKSNNLSLDDASTDRFNITGNTVNGKANNLFVESGKTIQSAAINSPSRIGVTTEVLPTAGNEVPLVVRGNYWVGTG